MAPRQPRGTTYWWPHGAMFVGADLVASPHEHYAANLLFALSGSVRVRMNGKPWSEHRAVVVAPNVRKEVSAEGTTIVALLIDSETRSHRRVAHFFESGDAVVDLSPEVERRLTKRATSFLEDESGPEAFWQAAIDVVSGPLATSCELDSRVAMVLQLIKRSMPKIPQAGELARSVGLSEGRLVHLFTEEVGIPLRRYELWLRARDTMFLLAAGAGMAEAAVMAGFSDPAHFSRAFRSMFGLAPSTILRSSRLIRVVFRSPVIDELIAPHQRIDLERWAEVIETLPRTSPVSPPSFE